MAEKAHRRPAKLEAVCQPGAHFAGDLAISWRGSLNEVHFSYDLSGPDGRATRCRGASGTFH